MRPDQLTITVLSKAFRSIPETIFLVSDRGTIAVAEDGIFQDVDDLIVRHVVQYMGILYL